MVDRMEAVVCPDFGEWSVQEVPRPEPAADEALIAVRRVQLSVTECQRFYGEEVSGRETIHEQMQEGDGRPFGHEFSGEIVETGPDVDALDVGDRVYAPAKVPCGECPYCRTGHRGLCDNLTSIGKGRPGALAEYLAAPVEALRRVPDGVSDAEAAAMQPLASAILCVHDARVELDDTVAVFGTGVMGAHAGQLSLVRGAGEVYAVDVVPEKLEFAAERGMEPVDAREVDPVAAIDDATDGIGADVVFASVGGNQSRLTSGDDPVAHAYDMVRTDGKLVQVGLLQGEMALSPRNVRGKEVDWIHPRHGVRSFGPNSDTGELAGKLVADGRVDIARYVDREVEGLESFEKAVEMTANKPEYDALGPTQIVVDRPSRPESR
ncbi:MAG: zinc-binding dehydrogenase [Haloferacaceae archaeon]